MKHILLTVLLLLTFSGCGDNKEEQAKHDAKVAQEARAELLVELKVKEEALRKAQVEAQKNDKLSKIGISTTDGKIVIDTNKTKNFFKEFGNRFKKKVEKFSTDLEKGIVQDKNAGIEIDNKHINIDLNKTKSFIEGWGKRMQDFVRDMDTIAQEIDNTKH